MYAQFAETIETTIGVRKGKHPQCVFCEHITECTFSVSEESHNVELPKSCKGVAFACVQCWSRLAKEEGE